jgi:hypothetical protein
MALEGLIDQLDAAAREGDLVSIDHLLEQALPGFTPSGRPWHIKV